MPVSIRPHLQPQRRGRVEIRSLPVPPARQTKGRTPSPAGLVTLTNAPPSVTYFLISNALDPIAQLCSGFQGARMETRYPHSHVLRTMAIDGLIFIIGSSLALAPFLF